MIPYQGILGTPPYRSLSHHLVTVCCWFFHEGWWLKSTSSKSSVIFWPHLWILSHTKAWNRTMFFKDLYLYIFFLQIWNPSKFNGLPLGWVRTIPKAMLWGCEYTQNILCIHKTNIGQKGFKWPARLLNYTNDSYLYWIISPGRANTKNHWNHHLNMVVLEDRLPANPPGLEKRHRPSQLTKAGKRWNSMSKEIRRFTTWPPQLPIGTVLGFPGPTWPFPIWFWVNLHPPCSPMFAKCSKFCSDSSICWYSLAWQFFATFLGMVI